MADPALIGKILVLGIAAYIGYRMYKKKSDQKKSSFVLKNSKKKSF